MINTKYRKAELLKHVEYKCVLCGNKGEWMGQNLNLQIDHIDGDNANNVINNLRFLCPNCHSQTHNFAGRNAKTKNFNRPSKEEFIALLEENTVKQISIIKAVSLRTVYQWFNFFIRDNRDVEKPRPSSTRKFSCLEVAEIRQAKVGIRELARSYNISHSLIKDIRKLRLYKDCN